MPRSALALRPLAEDEGVCLMDRNRTRPTFTSLYAESELGEEGRSEETSMRNHDEGAARPRTSAFAYEAGSRDEGAEKNEPVRHRLNPMQVQQQALIRRIRTLEARRDWRGVLAAMVSEMRERLL